MSPLQQLSKLKEFLEFLGNSPIPADKVLAMLGPALRQIQTENKSSLDGQRVSHARAKELTGRSDSWFRARMTFLGGKSRLERWAETGLAHQEGRQWFISISVLQEEIARHAARSGQKKVNGKSANAGSEATDVDSLHDALNQFLNAA